MLGNLEALYQIELSDEVDRLGKVGSMKVIRIDQQVTSVDVGSVDPGYRCACGGPGAQPCALPASEIDDAADRDRRDNLGDDPQRRPRRKGRQKTVEIGSVCVHASSHLVSCDGSPKPYGGIRP